jgi:hypothetical protein
MSHFAKLDDNNIVIFVTVGREEDDGKELELQERTGDVYKQTSYNTYGGVHYTGGEPSDDQSKAFRFNYAGISFTYDAERDAFISPQPYPSWVLDEATCLWAAPIDYPADGGLYVWDEPTVSWVAVEE